MPQTNQPVEFNTFVGGLVTEANPLTFPPNASLDEDNFLLNKDGSRRRRLGIDYESGFSLIGTTEGLPLEGDIAISHFEWENVGGDPALEFSVVQTGKQLKFFSRSNATLSEEVVHETSFPLADPTQDFGMATVDGILVVATGEKEIYTFSWDGATVTQNTTTLKIRDFFGVEDIEDGVDLFAGSGISVRPRTLTDEHRYNLRNQTFAIPRWTFSDATLLDPINEFRLESLTSLGFQSFPSNADNLNAYLFARPDGAASATIFRYHPVDMVNDQVGTTPTPRGYFIIDALERGASRLEQEELLRQRNPDLSFPVSDLPEDKTPGGATVLSQFAGRIFYAGFSAELVDGDSKSPRMSSYVLFSKLVNDLSDIGTCHQVGDPTSRQEPDIIDTDGGFIKLDGAYDIQAMINIGSSLIVVASNGVWAISGGTETGFSATAYISDKITEHGCLGRGSVVVVDNTVMYWGDDGIYHVTPNEFGDFVANNISNAKIQRFYDDIDATDKAYCKASYDSYERKVNWVYQNRPGSVKDTKLLVLDINLAAFSPVSVSSVTGALPKLTLPLNTSPFIIGDVQEDIVVGGTQVVVGVDDVVVSGKQRVSSLRETAFLVITQLEPTIQYTFALQRDTNFVDWFSFDNVGVDYESFLLTGWFSGNDYQRTKKVGYLTTHFIRTEDGFEDVGGDLVPTNQSSCLVQSQWDWANSAASNRFGKTYQAYRYNRFYLPEDVNDGYDTGFETIVTKNKLRGRGKVVSIKFSSEAGKDLRILGWSMMVGVNSNV